MQPRFPLDDLYTQPLSAVASDRKCAHGQSLVQQAYSVRPIPAELNML